MDSNHNERLLHRAISLHKKGAIGAAESLYREVLRIDPGEPNSLHLLGLIASEKGEKEEAIQLVSAAITREPANSTFVGNLGVLLRKAGKVDQAVQAYQRAIELEPENPEHFFHLGKSLRILGDTKQSEIAYRKALQRNPRFLAPVLSLVRLLIDAGRYHDAIETCSQAILSNPGHAELHIAMGSVFRRMRRFQSAFDCYVKADELDGGNPEVLARLATICFLQHRFEDGDQYLNSAAILSSKNLHVLTCAGLRESLSCRYERAVQIYAEAADLYPDHSTTLASLSVAQRKHGELKQSLETIDRTLAIEPRSPEALAVKSGVLLSLGQHREAEQTLRSALHQCDLLADAHHNLLLCMQYSPESTASSILQAHIEWGARFGNQSSVSQTNPRLGIGSRRIRVGFVSSDLGAHPVGYFTAQLFEFLNRDRFETYVYSDRFGQDEITIQIKTQASQWRECVSLCDEELHATIVDDEIDVLFDLAGHTAQNRLNVFALRAAPIQITWAGYVGTTGLPQMDYLLADSFHIAADESQYFSEQILRMPHGYVSYQAPSRCPDVAALPFRTSNRFTYGSMCNPAKVNELVLEAWGKILSNVPGSQLVLSYNGWQDELNQNRVREGLAKAGCDCHVIFTHRSNIYGLMDLYNLIDLALDTFPYSAGLTTCEALWMGVPTLTFPGKWFAGRHSTSHMMNVGLPQFVGKNVQEYVEKAIGFAEQGKELAEIRSQLRDQMKGSPLCDGKLFTKNFEKLIEEVWLEDCTIKNRT